MEDRGTYIEGAPAKGQKTTGGTLPELANPKDTVRVMIEDRECREKEIVKERQRRGREITEERKHRKQEREEERRCSDLQQEESERQIVEMHRQMEWLQ